VYKQIIAVAIALCAAGTPLQAADLSANIGWNSDYVFRGILQDTSSANAGLDLEEGGFYLGTWAASVSPGLEYDLYGGYNGTFKKFGYGIGATGYFYTDDYDDTYLEINLNGSWKFFSVEAAIGKYENSNGPSQDYLFLAGKAEYQNFYGLIGGYSRDFEGSYIELGYGDTLTVADTDLFDWSLAIIFRGDDLPTKGTEDDTYLTLGFTKGFAINLPKN
jgi:uncharacterized protein (TIGR02001 family)